MSLSVGVHASASNISGTTVATPARATTTGSGIIVGFAFDDTVTFVSLTHTGAEAVVLIGSEQTVAGGKGRLYYIPLIVGQASHTFTLTVSAGAVKSIWMVEGKTTNLSGLALDQQNAQNDATTPFVSPTVTTTIADELLVALSTLENLSTSGNTHTAGASFTKQDEVTDGTQFWTGASGTRIVSATAGYASSWTMAGTPTDTVQWIATFSESASGGPTQDQLWSGIAQDINLKMAGRIYV